MLKEEKALLYNFFKTASDFISGYSILQEKPIFCDDTSIKIAACDLLRINNNNGNKFNFMLICEVIENDDNEIFSGKAADLLDKMLSAINLKRGKNLSVFSLEENVQNDKFHLFLDDNIKNINSKAMLVVGNYGIQSLLKTNEDIHTLHGKFFNYKNLPLLAIFHPNSLLKDANLKRPAWEDLKNFNVKISEIENQLG